MALHRPFESEPSLPDPVVRVDEAQELRRAAREAPVARGTLACPRCDAPVSVGPRGARPGEPLSCPVCRHRGPVRDFLSLGTPTRPAHVAIRVVGGRR